MSFLVPFWHVLVSRQLIARKIRTFVQMGSERRRLLAEAMFSLALASLALKLVPFRVIAARLGKALDPAEAAALLAHAAEVPERRQVIYDVSWAVRTAAAYMPFRALCFEQAIAAKHMLQRRRIAGALHLGVVLGGAGADMTAHAWLDAAGAKVTGYPIAAHLTEVACFV